MLSDKVKGIAPYWQAPVSSHHDTPQVTTGSNTCVSCLSGVQGVVGCTQAAPTGSSASHNNQNHHKMAKPVLMRSQRFAMTAMHGPSCLQFKVTEQLLPVQYYSTTCVATEGSQGWLACCHSRPLRVLLDNPLQHCSTCRLHIRARQTAAEKAQDRPLF